VLLYGVPENTGPGGSVAAAMSPVAKTRSLPRAKPVAVPLAASPVASPDGTSVALVTVDAISGGAKVTLTLVNSASAVVEKQGSLALTGLAGGTSIIATPVFAPGTTTIALVLGVTEPTQRRQATKTDRATGSKFAFEAVTWVSHHELAYFDTTTAARRVFLDGLAASCGALLALAGASKVYRGVRGLAGDTAIRRALRIPWRWWRVAEPAAGCAECVVGVVVCAGLLRVAGAAVMAGMGGTFCALLGYARVKGVAGGCGCIE
jgi:hypothetical protein